MRLCQAQFYPGRTWETPAVTTCSSPPIFSSERDVHTYQHCHVPPPAEATCVPGSVPFIHVSRAANTACATSNRTPRWTWLAPLRPSSAEEGRLAPDSSTPHPPYSNIQTLGRTYPGFLNLSHRRQNLMHYTPPLRPENPAASFQELTDPELEPSCLTSAQHGQKSEASRQHPLRATCFRCKTPPSTSCQASQYPHPPSASPSRPRTPARDHAPSAHAKLWVAKIAGEEGSIDLGRVNVEGECRCGEQESK